MMWKLTFTQNLPAKVYCKLIHNHQNVDATKISFIGWMDRQMVVIYLVEHYSALKRKELSKYAKTWRKLKCRLLSERSSLKRLHTAWFYLCAFWKRQNLRAGGCRRFGGKRRLVSEAWGILGDGETILCDTIMADTRNYLS